MKRCDHCGKALPKGGVRLSDGRVRASGVPHHRAYDLGMPRLSCSICIYATPDALLLAGQHRPDLLDEYADLELRLVERHGEGNQTRFIDEKRGIADIRDALKRGIKPRLPLLTWGPQ